MTDIEKVERFLEGAHVCLASGMLLEPGALCGCPPAVKTLREGWRRVLDLASPDKPSDMPSEVVPRTLAALVEERDG